ADPPTRRQITAPLRLAAANGSDDDTATPRGIEQQRGVGRRPRQAAEMAARRHAADEDSGVARVGLHADAIAEDGAAGERAGGIDGDDSDAHAALAERACDLIVERALAGAGRTG